MIMKSGVYFITFFVCCVGIVTGMDNDINNQNSKCNNSLVVDLQYDHFVKMQIQKMNKSEIDNIKGLIRDMHVSWSNSFIFTDHIMNYFDTLSNGDNEYLKDVINYTICDILRYWQCSLDKCCYWNALSIVLLNIDIVNEDMLNSDAFIKMIDSICCIVKCSRINYQELSNIIKINMIHKNEFITKIAIWIVLNNHDLNTMDSDSLCSDQE